MPHEDVVIIGAGISGVASAFYLLRHADFSGSVSLVEQDDVAAGASGKAGGFFARDWHGPRSASLAHLSCDLVAKLSEKFDGARAFGFRTMETVGAHAAAKKKGKAKAHLEDNPVLRYSAMRQPPNGLGREERVWLDRLAEEPELLSTNETTGQVAPYLLTKLLFEEARKRGLRYYRAVPQDLILDADGAPKAIAIAETASKVEPVYASDPLPSTSLPCTKLVLAAGPWTGQIARRLQVKNADQLPISNLPGFSVLLRTKSPITATAVFAGVSGSDCTNSPEFFPRPPDAVTDEPLVYIGGENGGVPLSPSAAEADSLVTKDRIDNLLESAKRISSAFDDAEVVREALCYRPTTADAAPAVGEMAKNVYVATGAGPWGITLAAGIGQVIAELLVDGKAKSADISGLAPTRFFS